MKLQVQLHRIKLQGTHSLLSSNPLQLVKPHRIKLSFQQLSQVKITVHHELVFYKEAGTPVIVLTPVSSLACVSVYPVHPMNIVC